MQMNSKSIERPQDDGADNRFVRHPVATISIFLAAALFICLLILELFLKTFSGLGNPPLYELSPLYGYRLKPNQVIEPRGGLGFLYASRVTTNNLGLRAADYWEASPQGKILFLGDSVTYGGQYVSDAQLFSSVAGSSLPGWLPGNGGVNAWGVENMAGLVIDYGFSPAEAVVTCVIEGDFYRGTTRASSVPYWSERPRFALQDLVMQFAWRANESRYGSTIDPVVRDEAHLDKIVDRAARRLKDLDDHFKRKGVQNFLFILPTRSQVVGGETPDARVREALKRYEVDAFYLLPELLAMRPDGHQLRQWFHDEVHLEPPGHQTYGALMGEALARSLPAR